MILIIGESCLDVFHYGECLRLCPEAPVPVFKSIRTSENGGMAMNVYQNVLQMGSPAEIITNNNWKFIKKTRFVEEKSNHMFMRLDENENDYGHLNIDNLNLEKYSAIIVSDYNKGFLSTKSLKKISTNHPLTFLDTKKILGDWSKDFTYIKINGPEFERTKHTINKDLYKKLIITQGPKGSTHMGKRYPVPMVEVKDVSGAGDTFISALCCRYLKSHNIQESILFANECATTVVQKRGVSTI